MAGKARTLSMIMRFLVSSTACRLSTVSMSAVPLVLIATTWACTIAYHSNL